MAPLGLVTEFPAKKPQLLIPFDTYADVETWVKPVEVIRQAAIALTEDAAMFKAIDYHKTRTEDGEEFLRSLAYYAEVLIQDSLVGFEKRFEVYSHTPTSTTTELTGNRSIGSMLLGARQSYQELTDFLVNLVDTLGWEFHWKIPSAGDLVPTASPYQLLYQMICKKKLHDVFYVPVLTPPVSLQKQAYLALPELDSGIERVTSDAPCGRPTMLFVSGTFDLSHIFFGANETAWGELTAVSAITRIARDIRLRHYVPVAMEAFKALQRKEIEALAELENESGGASDKEDLVWKARARAIDRMRSDQSTLGGEKEMGIALRPPTWAINQGCYLCQGMMEYQSPKSWNENQRRKYILKFD
ncbi:hypothetical protein M431DRAFT_518183 [Trichoderma harzianum CBS 226.95]|uniref:Uncharacterized protein n=1 Tax=Trichoderma harzianum CBS 226.95 TaxID=983964 RepID=A0A2T4AH61_TRIHA|nr:hypothetical protein M431DRAFT_518183 [Trichoderma harzianum CBS 226.95]PTB56424.1 hypothetical protein M431DRAFT_518183 [Trichoderma harzianum CBS 226.95]